MLAIPASRRVGVANVSPGTVARPARTVIPTARVLRYIAADSALVPDLRRSNQFGGFREKPIFFFDDGVFHHLGESSHRTDFDTITGGANAPEFLDSAEVYHDLRFPDSILQPVKGIHSPGH